MKTMIALLIALTLLPNAFAGQTAGEDGFAIAKAEMKEAVRRCKLPATEIAMEAIASKRVDGPQIGVTPYQKPRVLEQDTNHITFSIQGKMAGDYYNAIVTVESEACSELGAYAIKL